MPILTPTFPHQNSTFNVTSNTLRLIREKMVVAADICDGVLKGEDSWETLFQVLLKPSHLDRDKISFKNVRVK